MSKRNPINTGISLNMDMADMSFILGSAQDISHGEQQDYATVVVLCLPLNREEFRPGNYQIVLNDQQISVSLEEIASFDKDPIAMAGKKLQIGTPGTGLPSLPFDVFTDNRSTYPAFFAKIVFPYRIAKWIDAKHETGLKMNHDYERMQITGSPDNEEKIISLTVLNRLFKTAEYGRKVNPIAYDDITAFIEIYFRKGNDQPILRKLTALAAKTAYKDAVEDYFLLGFDRLELNKSLTSFNQKFNNRIIDTERNLLDIVLTVLTDGLKHQIENRRWIDAFWDGERKIKYNGINIVVPRMPKNETRIQPTLHVVLEMLLSPMGIQVVRESDEGVGSLDFRILYTTRAGLGLSVGIEFKLAHNKEIQKGIRSQLPLYLKAIRSNSGIFSVMWFKDKDGKYFKEPRTFQKKETTEWLMKEAKDVSNKNGIELISSLIDASIKDTASKITDI